MHTSLRCLAALIIAGSATHAVSAREVLIEDARVERTEEGRVLVYWRSTPVDAPIDVALGGADGRELELISDDDRDGQHELSVLQAAQRPLIYLLTSSGKRLITAERLLPLEGGRNFRDLGGYLTADGHQVKWGRVYRSGTMANLIDSDYDLLQSLGIRVICDFRTSEEREREPTRWQAISNELDYRTRNYAADSNLREAFAKGTPDAAAMRDAMMRLYGEVPYEHAESYRTMFKALAAGEAPLAFNCSAGKDRTGVAAALLLTMLGVPRDTVIEDYALSEKLVNYEAQYARSPPIASSKPNPWAFIEKLPAEVRAPLLRSEPDYIRTALTAIEKREGSLDQYFERVLGISKAEQESIRSLLLEKAPSAQLSRVQ
jgi:protein-tyrosine phosphatase